MKLQLKAAKSWCNYNGHASNILVCVYPSNIKDMTQLVDS
jgi:hypothetical protein